MAQTEVYVSETEFDTAAAIVEVVRPKAPGFGTRSPSDSLKIDRPAVPDLEDYRAFSTGSKQSRYS